MKIAFTGKGGSGKTTLAYRTTEYFLQNGYDVLAIDADHNMNFAYSLSPSYDGPFLGNVKPDEINLGLYVSRINKNLKLMVAGPHTEEVLEGKRCSHSLSSPLKSFLPQLKLGAKEIVIVDEKAGSDGVGTGMLVGFDHVFIITEPTIYSTRVAEQISNILDYYKIPYSFIINKASVGRPIDFKKECMHIFKTSERLKNMDSHLEKEELEGIEKIAARAGHNSS